MKRAEALAEITYILDTEWDLAHPDKAELILKKLEEMSVLPPKEFEETFKKRFKDISA